MKQYTEFPPEKLSVAILINKTFPKLSHKLNKPVI